MFDRSSQCCVERDTREPDDDDSDRPSGEGKSSLRLNESQRRAVHLGLGPSAAGSTANRAAGHRSRQDHKEHDVERDHNQVQHDTYDSANLARLGQPLVVRVGDAVSVLRDMVQHYGATALWSHEETGNAWTYQRDLRVGAWCRDNALPWTELRQNGVHRRLRSRNGWATTWDRFMAEPLAEASALAPLDLDLGTIPTARALHLAQDPCPDRQPGGRAVAQSCLRSFLNTRAEPYRWAMSSPLQGARACSRLSPHLAWGSLSLREVTQATWQRQSDPELPRNWQQ
ncbi:MAG: hypothetical protein IH830_12165, partial [Planctomycetes bacterium]|nr:hypothetical protein [Planctomycetota bacterium]